MTRERLRQKVERFRELIDHNFKAVEELADIRLGYATKNRDEEALFSACVDSVREMIKSYSKLANLSQKEANKYRFKLRKVARNGAKSAASIRLAKRFGYEGSSVIDEKLERFFRSVENLSPEIARPNPLSFKLPNVRTCLLYTSPSPRD